MNQKARYLLEKGRHDASCPRCYAQIYYYSYVLNVFIDIQKTSKELIQVDTDKIMTEQQ